MLTGSSVINYFMFIIINCHDDMQSASVNRRSKIYVEREVFSVPKHVKSLLYYVIYHIIYYIIYYILYYIK